MLQACAVATLCLHDAGLQIGFGTFMCSLFCFVDKLRFPYSCLGATFFLLSGL